jgi:hypothetical protein
VRVAVPFVQCCLICGDVFVIVGGTCALFSVFETGRCFSRMEVMEERLKGTETNRRKSKG